MVRRIGQLRMTGTVHIAGHDQPLPRLERYGITKSEILNERV
jgi:hypothetical protein